MTNRLRDPLFVVTLVNTGYYTRLTDREFRRLSLVLMMPNPAKINNLTTLKIPIFQQDS